MLSASQIKMLDSYSAKYRSGKSPFREIVKITKRKAVESFEFNKERYGIPEDNPKIKTQVNISLRDVIDEVNESFRNKNKVRYNVAGRTRVARTIRAFFRDENIERASWKYFPPEKAENENFLAVGNWDHQYEWRYDLDFDFDKLHEYAPWVIQRWNEVNLKPLTEEYKEKINWNLRNLESTPKLKPWKGNLENQTYENPMAYRDLEVIDDAIEKIIGIEKKLEKARDIKDELAIFKSYFRDLGS